MNRPIAMDKEGRVVLPKRFRDRFRLKEGDRLDWDMSDKQITLRPAAAVVAPLWKERGVGVYRSGHKTEKSILELVDEVRNERGRI